MSLTRRLRGSLERRGATGPWGDSSIPPPGAGGTMTESTALQVIAVYSCVSILADSVATLPLYAYQRMSQSRRPIEPPPRLLVRPFDEITLQDWLTQTMASLALRGNAYNQIAQRDELGYPTQLIPLHPDVVNVRRNPAGKREYRVNGTLVPSADVVHIPGLMLPGALTGINPIEQARTAFNLARSAEAYGAAFFANSARSDVVIQVPGSLNQTEAQEMARAWISAHQGVGNAHLPAVVTGGATVATVSINPDDAQFLQTRNLSRLEIAMLFRIPPHMLGDVDRTTSWGAGIEAQELSYVTNTLRPWLSRIESALTDMLPEGIYARFNLAGRLRGDTLQRYTAHSMARLGGWNNIDEIREKEDEPPLPDGIGQGYLQPLNYAPLGSPPQPAQPTTEPGQRDALSTLLESILVPRTREVERDEWGRILRINEGAPNGHGPR